MNASDADRADRSRPDRSIQDLVRINPHQGSAAEYEVVRDAIRERAPGNVLVFGVGRDSRLWIRTNRGGRTVFLESDPGWIRRTREELRDGGDAPAGAPDARILKVSYDTRRFQWRWLLRRPARLMMDLPAQVLDTDWDVIFVDAPDGTRWKSPGRMQSVYTASVLASGSGETDVLVHDCDRRVERTYCDVYLGEADLVAEVDRLRHYRVG